MMHYLNIGVSSISFVMKKGLLARTLFRYILKRRRGTRTKNFLSKFKKAETFSYHFSSGWSTGAGATPEALNIFYEYKGYII